jgi:hypothetical protein
LFAFQLRTFCQDLGPAIATVPVDTADW